MSNRTTVAAAISLAVMDKLERLAAIDGVTTSAYVRKLIEADQMAKNVAAQPEKATRGSTVRAKLSSEASDFLAQKAWAGNSTTEALARSILLAGLRAMGLKDDPVLAALDASTRQGSDWIEGDDL